MRQFHAWGTVFSSFLERKIAPSPFVFILGHCRALGLFYILCRRMCWINRMAMSGAGKVLKAGLVRGCRIGRNAPESPENI
jgi:hypothetical protein